MNMGGGGPGGGVSSAATPEQLGALTEQLLNDHGINTFVIGFGLGTGQNEDGDSLNAIARAGGMLDNYIEVQDEAELTAALTDIGASVVSCTFDLSDQDPEEVNLDLVNVYFNGNYPVPMDKDCGGGMGWTWTDDSRTAIEFCDSACGAMQAGDVSDVSIKIMCTVDEVIIL
jgi:hypothetical protein